MLIRRDYCNNVWWRLISNSRATKSLLETFFPFMARWRKTLLVKYHSTSDADADHSTARPRMPIAWLDYWTPNMLLLYEPLLTQSLEYPWTSLSYGGIHQGRGSIILGNLYPDTPCSRIILQTINVRWPYVLWDCRARIRENAGQNENFEFHSP